MNRKILNSYNFLSFQKSLFSQKPGILDKQIYNTNKEFSAQFREGMNIYQNSLFDLNLKNLLNSMHLIRRDFETLVFYGNNPETYLLSKPPCKELLFIKQLKQKILFTVTTQRKV